MLEGVFVVVVFVVLFACIVGTAGLYKAKLVAMQDARYAAMWNATNNCDKTGPSYDPQSLSWPAAPTTQPDAHIPAMIGPIPLPKFDFTSFVEDGLGVSRATTTGSFRFMGVGGSVSSTSYATCNAPAVDANPKSVVERWFQRAWGFISHDFLHQMASTH
jgi:hypothetical protein